MSKPKDDEFAKAKEASEKLEERGDLEKATLAGGCFWCMEAAFEQLSGLEIYWLQINPTDAGGQFVDRGEQYTSAIYFHSDEQKKLAEESKSERENSGTYGMPIVTKILPADKFFVAEDYHQSYYIANKGRYKIYERGSGRKKYGESIINRGS